MNRSFKTIWNAARGQLVVVNEATTGHAQASGAAKEMKAGGESAVTKLRLTAMAALMTAALGCAPAHAMLDGWEGADFFWGGEFGTSTSGINAYDTNPLKSGPNFSAATWNFSGGANLITTRKDFSIYSLTAIREPAKVFIQRDTYVRLYDLENYGTLQLMTQTDFSALDLWNRSGTMTLGVIGTAKNLKASGGTLEIVEGALDLSEALTVEDGAVFTHAQGDTSAQVFTQTGGNVYMKGGSITSKDQAVLSGGTFEYSGGALNRAQGLKLAGGTFIANGTDFALAANDVFESGLVKTLKDGTVSAASDVLVTMNPGMTFENAEGSMQLLGGLVLTGGSLSQQNADGSVTIEKSFDMTSGNVTTTAGDVVVRNTTDGAAAKVSGGALNLAAGTALKADAVEVSGGALAGAGTMDAKTIAVLGSTTSTDGSFNLKASDSVSFKSATGQLVFNAVEAGRALVKTAAVSAKTLILTALGASSADPDVAADGSLRTDVFTASKEGGVFTNAGSLSIGALGAGNKAAFVNSGKLTFDSAKNQTIALTMSGADSSLSTADKTFFANSTFTVEDGAALDLPSLGVSTLGEGNNYIVKNAGFTGSLQGDAQSLIGKEAFDGMSVLKVGTVTSDSTVTLEHGGLLEAGAFALTKSGTVVLTGGAVKTTLQAMFEGVTSENILINAQSPADTTVVESGYLGVTDVGALKGGIADGISWTNGTVAFTDSSITTKAIAGAQAAVGTAAGAGAQNVNVVFTGRITGGAKSGVFDIEALEGFKAEQEQVSGSHVITPGIILTGTTLVSERSGSVIDSVAFTAADDATIPADATRIDLSIGFSKVSGAKTVTVGDGHTFVATGVARADGNTWKTDDAKILPDSGEVGVLASTKGGVAALGTAGLGYQTAGYVPVLSTDAGSLLVRNGEFGAKTATVKNAGVLRIEETGTLHLEVLDVDQNSSVENHGVYKSEGAAQTLGGAYTTAGAAAHSTFNDLVLTKGSTLKVAEGGAEEGGTLTLGEGSKWTVEDGTSIWKNVVAADDALLDIGAAGSVSFGAADSGVDVVTMGGHLTNAGTLSYNQKAVETGAFTNTGAKTADNTLGAYYNDLDVKGTHENAAGAYEKGRILTVLGVWTNNGTAEWETVGAEGTSSNTGTASFGSFTLTGADSAFRNSGTLSAGTAFSLNDGTFTNEGTLDASAVAAGTISGGVFENVEGAAASFKDVALSGNTDFRNAGSMIGETVSVEDGTLTNSGTMNFQTVNFETTGSTNSGTITADSVLVRKGGSLAGTGTLAGTVENLGTFKQEVVSGDVFRNATQASAEISRMTSTSVENAGSLTLGTVTNFDASKTYTHDASSGSLTVSDGSLFTGTNLVFTGGGNVFTKDVGAEKQNFTALAGELGANNVVIKGADTYTMTGAHSAAYGPGMTTVYVGTLKDESVVDIQAGGRLVTDDIALSGNVQNTKVNGGVISTSLNTLFADVTNEYVRIDAESPSDKGNVESNILGIASVGDLKNAVLSGIEFVKGAVSFGNSAVSLGVVTKVADALSNAFKNPDDVDVIFDGTITAGGAAAGDLTLDVVEKFLTEQAGRPGSIATNPGIILTSTALDGSSKTDGTVSWGTEGDVKGSIGFERVNHADVVAVDSGRGVLVGGELGRGLGEGAFDWTDANRLIASDTAGNGGSITIADGGSFAFGTNGTDKPHTGWIDKLENDGTHKFVNGEYGVKGNISGTGTTTVESNALVHVGGIQVEKSDIGSGSFVNEGKTVIDAPEGAGSGKIVVDEGAELVNKGEFDATVKPGEINGTATTESGGKTLWGDVTTGANGNVVVKNNGSEMGGVLDLTTGGKQTVEAGGSSVWDKILNANGSNAGTETVGTGSGREDGSKSSATDFNVAAGGGHVNTGTLDLEKAGNTVVEGSQATGAGGTTKFDDKTITSGGSSTVKTDGAETGDILEIENGKETVEQGGRADWNTIIVQKDGSIDNSGSLTGGKSTIDGSLTTKDGGTTTTTEKTITAGGTSTVEKGGTETGDKLVLEGGSQTVEQGGTGSWKDVVIAGGRDASGNDHDGSFTNGGKTTVGTVTVDKGGSFTNQGELSGKDLTIKEGGELLLDGGKSGFENTTVEGGATIVVGNDRELSPSNKSSYDLSNMNPVAGSIFVIGNGEVQLGAAEDFDDRINAPQLPASASKLVVGTTVHIADKGSVAVGRDTYTLGQSGSQGSSNTDFGTNGGLYFGADSVTVVDVPTLQGQPAFKADGAGQTVVVEDGATLILGNVTKAGTYVITDGFAGTPLGWLDEDHLYALNEDGTGLDWVLDLGFGNNRIWVDATLADVRTVYPDLVLPSISNDALKHASDPRGAADQFLSNALKNKDLSVWEKTRIINTVAQIGSAGAAQTTGFNGMTSAVNTLEGRYSFASEAFTPEGLMRTGETGSSTWATLLGSNEHADSLKASGRMEGGYKTDVYGVMAGLDHQVEGTGWRLGGALSYQKADVESQGNWLPTTNDTETFGIQAFMNFSPWETFNLVGSVGYFHAASDIDTPLPAAAGFSKANAKVKTNLVAAGVRAEGRFALPAVEGVSVIPHAGVRMLVSKSGSFDTKLDGAKAFSTSSQSAVTGQLPLGVTVRGDFTTASGWTIRPTADVTVIPQFGDRKVSSVVTSADSGLSDAVQADLTGDFGASATIGLSADYGPVSVGASYGFTGGSDGQKNNTANLTVRYVF